MRWGGSCAKPASFEVPHTPHPHSELREVAGKGWADKHRGRKSMGNNGRYFPHSPTSERAGSKYLPGWEGPRKRYFLPGAVMNGEHSVETGGGGDNTLCMNGSKLQVTNLTFGQVNFM